MKQVKVGGKENPTERGSKCSEIVFGCHQTVQNLAVGLATPGAEPGRASAAQAFWKVRMVMRELGCSWRALEGVRAWCCLGLCLPVGRTVPGVGSDEGNSHRDARGLCPLGRVMAHQVLHHRVFGHVLHQVGLLWAGVRFTT